MERERHRPEVQRAPDIHRDRDLRRKPTLERIERDQIDPLLAAVRDGDLEPPFVVRHRVGGDPFDPVDRHARAGAGIAAFVDRDADQRQRRDADLDPDLDRLAGSTRTQGRGRRGADVAEQHLDPQLGVEPDARETRDPARGRRRHRRHVGDPIGTRDVGDGDVGVVRHRPSVRFVHHDHQRTGGRQLERHLRALMPRETTGGGYPGDPDPRRQLGVDGPEVRVVRVEQEADLPIVAGDAHIEGVARFPVVEHPEPDRHPRRGAPVRVDHADVGPPTRRDPPRPGGRGVPRSAHRGRRALRPARRSHIDRRTEWRPRLPRRSRTDRKRARGCPRDPRPAAARRSGETR